MHHCHGCGERTSPSFTRNVLRTLMSFCRENGWIRKPRRPGNGISGSGISCGYRQGARVGLDCLGGVHRGKGRPTAIFPKPAEAAALWLLRAASSVLSVEAIDPFPRLPYA